MGLCHLVWFLIYLWTSLKVPPFCSIWVIVPALLMIVGHVCKRIMLIVLPVEGNETVFSELKCCKNQQTTRIWKRQQRIHNIDIDIHKPHICIMCVYCLMSMCIDDPNKLDYKQTNHKILFQLFLFLVEKRATLPLIFLSSLICLQTAGCISVKFLQIRDVLNRNCLWSWTKV